MKKKIQRAAIMGLQVALAMAVGGCQVQPAGAPCGDGLCPEGWKCVQPSNSDLLGTQKMCVVQGCGNSLIEMELGEECDDGEKNDDRGHCRKDCHLNRCGNGRVDPPDEECDDGSGNGDNKDCRSDCIINRCGDGFVDTKGQYPEPCDGALPHSGAAMPVETAECNLDCTTPSCGDGKVNHQFKPDGVHPEQCDNGSVLGVNLNVDTAACTSECQINVCGDHHVLEGIEACDDGGVDTANCNANCTRPVCGDGLVNLAAGEQCDNGTINGVNQNQDTAACTSECQINVCGDHHVLAGLEECDDGRVDTVNCNANCTKPVCGDHYLNTVAGEQCDDGPSNGTTNSVSGCDSFCKTNRCGNGIVDVSAGEECDPGGGSNPMDTATCTSTCHISRCGDGHINPVNEMCDDGATNGDACDYNHPNCTRCNSTCTLMINPGGLFCGDGIRQDQFGEKCDPSRGPDQDGPNCNNDCTPVVCGDGHLNAVAGESCDDGNQDACGTCPATDCHDASTIKATQATGMITTVNGDKIGDLDTLRLDDGLGKTITLEFDLGGLHDQNKVPIPFAQDPATAAATIASRMVDAINTQAPAGFRITASVPAGGTTVTLTNGRKTAFGNTPIVVVGQIGITGGFVFSHSPPAMAGGAAGDCLMGTGCASGDDCKSGECSISIPHVCQ